MQPSRKEQTKTSRKGTAFFRFAHVFLASCCNRAKYTSDIFVASNSDNALLNFYNMRTDFFRDLQIRELLNLSFFAFSRK
jgi:hypothetical protein